jgi:8-oxo-dGTP pyrophosphatase MutT (NUDIX family)
MSRFPTRQAVSAGGLVVADRDDGPWVVLIAHRSASGVLQWTLPKGRTEEGEALEQTAVREVREETGLDAEVVDKLGVVDYWFVWRPDRVRYHKFVHYFLMAHLGGDVETRDDEAEEVVWLRYDEAIDRLTHPNERALVVAAEVAAVHPRRAAGGGR